MMSRELLSSLALAVAMGAVVMYPATPGLAIVFLGLTALGCAGWGFGGDRLRLVGMIGFSVLGFATFQNWFGWELGDDQNLAGVVVPLVELAGWIGYLVARTVRSARS